MYLRNVKGSQLSQSKLNARGKYPCHVTNRANIEPRTTATVYQASCLICFRAIGLG